MNSLFPILGNRFSFPDDFSLDSVFDRLGQNMKLPQVDIRDKEDHYELIADLPGLRKEDVQIQYNDNIFTITVAQDKEEAEKDDKGNYLRRERFSRSYQRQFLIDGIREEGIKAKMADGVLTVTLPKQKEQDKRIQRQITIE